MRPRAATVLIVTGLLLVAIAASRVLPGGTSARLAEPAQQPTFTNLSPAELDAMLKRRAASEAQFALVDVHVPNEGYLDGTDARIPYDQIASRLAELPGAKEGTFVLYCRSGRMSEIASHTLVSLGYRNVYNLDGGVVAWQAAGFRVEPD